MIAPLILGYVVGAVGIYTLLHKVSPVVAEDHVAQLNTSGGPMQVEIIELFPAEHSADQAKAA